MSTIKDYILLIRANFKNVLCYAINIFEYFYDLGISMGSNDIYFGSIYMTWENYLLTNSVLTFISMQMMELQKSQE